MRHSFIPTLLLTLGTLMLMAFSCKEGSQIPSDNSLAGSKWEAETADVEEGESNTFTLLFKDEKHFTIGLSGAYFEGEYYYQEPAVVLTYPDEGAEASTRGIQERQPRAVLMMTPDDTLIGYPYADAPSKPQSFTFRRVE